MGTDAHRRSNRSGRREGPRQERSLQEPHSQTIEEETKRGTSVPFPIQWPTDGPQEGHPWSDTQRTSGRAQADGPAGEAVHTSDRVSDNSDQGNADRNLLQRHTFLKACHTQGRRGLPAVSPGIPAADLQILDASPLRLLPWRSRSHLPPSKRLMRSDTLLGFSFETHEAEAGFASSILGCVLEKAFCLGTWGLLGEGNLCRCNGFGGTVEKEEDARCH